MSKAFQIASRVVARNVFSTAPQQSFASSRSFIAQRAFFSQMQQRSFAAQRFFAESHEWISVEEDQKTITMGVSDFAQKELGSIVYVDMPSPPHGVDAGDSVAAIECGDGKAVGEVYAHQEMEVTEVNEAINDDPSIVNADCYGDGWLIKGVLADDFVQGEMMDEGAYEKYLETCERHNH